MSRAYYNEIEPYAAQWIRNLIAAGHIADGDVDERSIVDVQPADLAGYTQCHFFAGIGGWSHALRLAGWSDDRPVWTGSCPCQPFSAAGKQGGFGDARHLWPEWFRLIRECRPGVVFGEQVASPAGLGWLDLVHSDMEDAGYAFAAVDCSSAGVGAPHIRQRLGFVADAALDGGRALSRQPEPGIRAQKQDRGRGVSGELADADDAGSQGRAGMSERAGKRAPRASGVAGRLADASEPGRGEQPLRDDRADGRSTTELGRLRSTGLEPGRTSPLHGFWRDADWLLCRDGKWRPTESIVQPLADGVSDRLGFVRSGEGYFLSPLVKGATARVGRLRGYGNAINPWQFAELIAAFQEISDAAKP